MIWDVLEYTFLVGVPVVGVATYLAYQTGWWRGYSAGMDWYDDLVRDELAEKRRKKR